MIASDLHSDLGQRSRDLHLKRAKERALGVLARGDGRAAVAEMVTALLEHADWRNNPGMAARAADGMQSVAFGTDAVRHWIEAWR